MSPIICKCYYSIPHQNVPQLLARTVFEKYFSALMLSLTYLATGF